MELTRFERWDLESDAVDIFQPKKLRLSKARALRADQYRIVAEREAAGIQGNWSTYRDSRGRLGVDRYIQEVTAMKRRSRAMPSHRPWSTLLSDWTAERRCDHAFAVNAAGEVVHHDDPVAVRWCLAGWLAHRCMRPREQWRHGHKLAPWWEYSDDRNAKRLLDEVWALVPERQRAVVERAWRERVKAKDRKRIDQHPLGYWWFIAPHLAARFLGLTPPSESSPGAPPSESDAPGP